MTRITKSLYPAPLTEPIVRRRSFGLLGDIGEDERIVGERVGKIDLLFEHYKIPFDHTKSWQSLALCLAFEHVPGLAVVEVAPRGRGAPKKWGVTQERELVQAVDAVLKDRNRGIADAVSIAVKRNPTKWRTKDGHIRKSKSELAALETRYYECKKRVESFNRWAADTAKYPSGTLANLGLWKLGLPTKNPA